MYKRLTTKSISLLKIPTWETLTYHKQINKFRTTKLKQSLKQKTQNHLILDKEVIVDKELLTKKKAKLECQVKLC